MKIKVSVKPNSKNSKIAINSEGVYCIDLKSPPKKNEANLEIIKLLAHYFKISHKNIIIKAGLSNRKKIVEVKNEV